MTNLCLGYIDKNTTTFDGFFSIGLSQVKFVVEVVVVCMVVLAVSGRFGGRQASNRPIAAHATEPLMRPKCEIVRSSIQWMRRNVQVSRQ